MPAIAEPPTKRRKGPPSTTPPLRGRTPGCFRCDTTGKLCKRCGEAPAACDCDGSDIDDEEQWDPCTDCAGTGQ